MVSFVRMHSCKHVQKYVFHISKVWGAGRFYRKYPVVCYIFFFFGP
jgi:hypothetical protein